MVGFKDWCDLLSVQSVIDYTQIHMQKPKGVSTAECFYTNPKLVTCNYKQWLITKSGFEMFLLD